MCQSHVFSYSKNRHISKNYNKFFKSIEINAFLWYNGVAKSIKYLTLYTDQILRAEFEENANSPYLVNLILLVAKFNVRY